MASSKIIIESHIQVIDNNLMECINTCFESAIDVGQNISEISDAESEEFKRTITKLMQEMIEIEKDKQQHISALKAMNSLAATDGTDFSAEFESKLAQLKHGDKKDYRSHSKYRELEDLLIDTDSLEEEIAALREKLTVSSSSEDIEVTEAEINTKCPYTCQTIVYPVRNKICGHVYDKTGITSYINSRKTKAKCPAVGCGNIKPITADILEDHTDLRKYIQLMNKLQALKV